LTKLQTNGDEKRDEVNGRGVSNITRRDRGWSVAVRAEIQAEDPRNASVPNLDSVVRSVLAIRPGGVMSLAEDAGLWERFRTGDAEALATIYRAHANDVVRAARAVLRDCAVPTAPYDQLASDLADVVQEAFAKAFAPEARRRFDDQRAFRPYLLQIARNAAVDHWRARRRHVLVDGDRLAEHLVRDEEVSAHDEEWAGADVVAVVERFIGTMSAEERRGYEALYVRGLSQREAAVELGVGRQVVRTIEGRLRTGLERALARSGHVEK
jgi:RNA polymerase sigma-70 factor, ECF subfamily